MLSRAGGLLAAVILSAAGLPAATPLPASFQKGLTEAGMAYTAPASWKAVPVRPNGDMNYEYALKHPTRKFEVRYAIRPLAGLLREYAAAKKKGEVMVDPNNFHEGTLQAMLLNISGGQDAPVQEFDAQAVRQEFGADWGATSLLTPSPSFAPGYKYCMVVALHKANRADAYYFYLAANKADLEPGMEPAFHSLRFR
ncbi:hypothetical protein EJV47_18340 [Hymenobacter gummosus]|uniref:PsbP C-terminal domain-containing protein n=1 Tax=Hymenobacter gummosus TaxID=1776032 RepID=A0A3S0ILS3_9BACT|nr:hypothetical protein [Hymenobacter gummosus]RTQ47879.1 hypothetical protein EJV47_18340 [Hymenobacter gummosus]